MKNPIERKPITDKTITPLRGEGNQSEFKPNNISADTLINEVLKVILK